MKHKILRGLIKLLSYLPLSVLRSLGGIIGIIAMKLSKRSSKRLRANLIITGMCTEENANEMAKKTAMELGKTLVETTCIAWQRTKEQNAKLIVKAKNFDIMEKELLSGKPIVFLTPHISNFEIALKYTASKIPRVFTVLYKPSKDQWFNDMMIKGRTEDNIKPVPTNRQGVFTLAKDLRAGGVIGVLPDSIASSGDGVWVEFYGKKVFATTLAAKMAMTPGAVSFIVATIRVKGGFEVEYIPFTPSSSDIATVVQDIYHVIEKVVLQAPEQYYWSYDRFRVPNHAPAL